MAPRQGRLGKIKDFVVDLAARAILSLALTLPYETRVNFSGWVFSRLIAPLFGYRRRIRDNLSRIVPEMPVAEMRRIERDVPDNFGRTLIEIYSGEEFVNRVKMTKFSGSGAEALFEAAHQGRPVVIATGHFGNYDVARAALIAHGLKVGALYKPMKNERFNRHYVRAISRIGTPLFPRGRRGMGEMVKFLRQGGLLGLLTDQHMGRGVRLDFFGHPAYTATSAADLALKYDALLIPVYAIRKKNGLDFDIIIESPILHGDPITMTQDINDSLERMVRDHMGQWLWIHRRWKG